VISATLTRATEIAAVSVSASAASVDVFIAVTTAQSRHEFFYLSHSYSIYTYRRNFRVIYEIGVEEHDSDVRFFTGSGNTAISRMRNEKYAI